MYTHTLVQTQLQHQLYVHGVVTFGSFSSEFPSLGVTIRPECVNNAVLCGCPEVPKACVRPSVAPPKTGSLGQSERALLPSHCLTVGWCLVDGHLDLSYNRSTRKCVLLFKASPATVQHPFAGHRCTPHPHSLTLSSSPFHPITLTHTPSLFTTSSLTFILSPPPYCPHPSPSFCRPHPTALIPHLHSVAPTLLPSSLTFILSPPPYSPHSCSGNSGGIIAGVVIVVIVVVIIVILVVVAVVW